MTYRASKYVPPQKWPWDSSESNSQGLDADVEHTDKDALLNAGKALIINDIYKVYQDFLATSRGVQKLNLLVFNGE